MVELKLYRSWTNLALDSPHGSNSYVSNSISNSSVYGTCGSKFTLYNYIKAVRVHMNWSEVTFEAMHMEATQRKL